MKIIQALLLCILFTLPARADQKSLLIGITIGLGVYTIQQGVVPVMQRVGVGTKRASVATAKGVRRAIVGPRKTAK
jgi:hypothetical protein